MASKKSAPAKKSTTAAAAADTTEAGQNLSPSVSGFKTQGVPMSQLKQANKDMSPEAIAARRSEAQKASQATRLPRTTTAHVRAADIKVEKAKEGDETANGLLRRIYSNRGEIVSKIGGAMVKVDRSDIIRQLQQMPPDAKSPLKLEKSPTDDLVHILS